MKLFQVLLQTQDFFFNVPGGTGKTFLINLILAKVRSTHGIALDVASSGIAATLLEGFRTAHSALKLSLLTSVETPICIITKQSNLAEVLRQAKILVCDESTMAHKKGIKALNRIMPDIRNLKTLMGGMTILLAGDFRQTLPVADIALVVWTSYFNTKNDQAALINDVLLKSFQGEEIIYYSTDAVVNTDEAVHCPVEFLNTINPAGLPYHKLSLRVGTPVMLLRNLKPQKTM